MKSDSYKGFNNRMFRLWDKTGHRSKYKVGRGLVYGLFNNTLLTAEVIYNQIRQEDVW